jgi:hypothetical protein
VYTGRVEKVVFWLNMQIPFPCILVIHGRLLSGVQAHLLPRKFSEKSFLMRVILQIPLAK